MHAPTETRPAGWGLCAVGKRQRTRACCAHIWCLCALPPGPQGLTQLFNTNGVHLPLQRVGPCTFALGGARASVRLVNGRLMARSGSGGWLDIVGWLERQPVAAC